MKLWKTARLELMNAVDVRRDLSRDPWTDLRGGSYRYGEITRVGLSMPDDDIERATVAVVVSLDDGSVAIAECSLWIARQACDALRSSRIALATKVVSAEMQVCRCGHRAFAHVLSPKGERRACSHGEQAGPCGCTEFESITNKVFPRS